MGSTVTTRGARSGRWRAGLHAQRERLRAGARVNRVYRTVVGVLGCAIVVLGLVLVPLPGPGWLVVFLGLAVLGSEFHWARRVNAFGQRQFHRWTRWVAARSWRTRLGLGSLTVVAVVALLWVYVAVQGLPTWTPSLVTAQLVRVPGL